MPTSTVEGESGLTRVWLPGPEDGRHGGFSMLNISASPNDDRGSTLSSVLETRAIPPRYYLSEKGARGIVNRATEYGKKPLPPGLKRALETVRAWETHRRRMHENFRICWGGTGLRDK